VARLPLAVDKIGVRTPEWAVREGWIPSRKAPREPGRYTKPSVPAPSALTSSVLTPKFLYFDLGNVLLRFDDGVRCRQMAAVAGIDPADVFQALFVTPLDRDYSLGRITTREFYDEFCRQTGARPDYGSLMEADRDIFHLNVSAIPLVAQLHHAGYRLGILSNTCENHWEYCLRRYAILRELFDAHALSHVVGAAKPDAAIYQAAAGLAGVRPHEIFFTDDMARNVEGARAAGFDAVQFTSASALVDELRARSLRFNY
jgi:glucose-1-phosphatase